MLKIILTTLFAGMLVGLILRLLDEGLKFKYTLVGAIFTIYVCFLYPVFIFPIKGFMKNKDMIRMVAESSMYGKGKNYKKEVNRRSQILKKHWKSSFVFKLWFSILKNLVFNFNTISTNIILDLTEYLNKHQNENKKAIRREVTRAAYKEPLGKQYAY